MISNVWQRHFNWLVVVVVLAGLLTGAAVASATRPSAPIVAPPASGSSAGAAAAASAQAGNRQSGGQTPGADATSRPVSGSIAALDPETITVRTQQGDTKVKIGNARIVKVVDGTASDLQQGQSVVVTGRQAQDGSYESAQIEILPMSGAHGAGSGAPAKQQ